MTPSTRRSWLRLAPLALVVALVHGALLLGLQPVERLRPAQPQAPAPINFATRTLDAMPPPEAVTAPALLPAADVRPQPVAEPVPRPAPRPRPRPVAATGPASSAAPGPAPAAARRANGVVVPPSAHFHYDVAVQAKGFNLRGQADLEWRHDGKDYEAKLELSSPLLPRRIQRSTGRITADGLAPLYFLDKSRNEQAAHFERDKGRVTFSNNRPAADLVPGLQDRLSVLLQLSAMAAGQPARFQAGTQITIPTTSTREAEDWIFGVEGEEDLRLPGGAVRALKLHRVPRKEFDQRLELWLAPRMDYAPVRVRLTNPNGDTVDQRWASTDKG